MKTYICTDCRLKDKTAKPCRLTVEEDDADSPTSCAYSLNRNNEDDEFCNWIEESPDIAEFTKMRDDMMKKFDDAINAIRKMQVK